MTTSADVAALVRALGEWVARPGNRRFLVDEQIPVLRRGTGDPAGDARLPLSAWFLGTYELARGQSQLFAGDSSGFEGIHCGTALLTSSLALRVVRARATGNEGCPFPLVQGAHALAAALAYREGDAGDLCAVYASLPDRHFAARDAWPLFARELLRIREGRRPQVSPRLGAFREVLLHWDSDPSRFARAMERALDDHVELASRRRGPFAEPWVMAAPLECLAARSIRERLGLATPKIEHALMHTNLVQMEPPARLRLRAEIATLSARCRDLLRASL